MTGAALKGVSAKRAASNEARVRSADIHGAAATVESEVADKADVTRRKKASMKKTTVGASLAPELQGHIGKKLRAVYGELVREPVPDMIMDVFKQLEAKERGGAKE